MNMEFKYTIHQVPRGARPDAEDQRRIHLIKFVSSLRLTYQIRLLCFKAYQENKTVVVHLPKVCKLSEELRDFGSKNRKLIKFERAKQ